MRVELAYPITESELLFATGAEAKSRLDRSFKYLSTDTRELEAGDLYIGLPGENYSDRDFIADAKRLGAVTISSSDDSEYFTTTPRSIPLLLAEYYKSKLERLITTIAITGSFGKTTTKSFLSAILKQKFKVHTSSGNNNNDIGLPLAILSANKDTEVLILECGTSGVGEIKALSKCARPNIAIITSIGTSHIASFGTREGIAKEKLDILSYGLPLLIRPDGEPLLWRGGGVFVGEEWYYKNSICPFIDQNELYLKLPSQIIKLPFNNKSLLSPLMLSVAAASSLGLSELEISRGVLQISPEDLRYRIIHLRRYSLIDDAYNASPETIIGAIDNLLSQSAVSYSAILGDIYELGDQAYDIHRALGREIAKRKLNRLYLYGSYAQATLSGIFEYESQINEIILLSGTVENIAEHLNNNLDKGELLLIKGSHGTGLHSLSAILKTLNQ